uniref:Uncharacterized protein n=1 Tax=Romanomermis culicivorax TaxID=13658 RepID=A0A915KTH9_ROMCU
MAAAAAFGSSPPMTSLPTVGSTAGGSAATNPMLPHHYAAMAAMYSGAAASHPTGPSQSFYPNGAAVAAAALGASKAIDCHQQQLRPAIFPRIKA